MNGKKGESEIGVYLDRLVAIPTFSPNKSLRLPSGFPLGVITPLHLIEVTGLISSDPGLVIHNFDWILRIDKIGLQL